MIPRDNEVALLSFAARMLVLLHDEERDMVRRNAPMHGSADDSVETTAATVRPGKVAR